MPLFRENSAEDTWQKGDDLDPGSACGWAIRTGAGAVTLRFGIGGDGRIQWCDSTAGGAILKGSARAT
jgi:hypothetical protein